MVLVSGQISSTYSSPLEEIDSGQYNNCRVSVGSRNMTSEAVTITVVDESHSRTITSDSIN